MRLSRALIFTALTVALPGSVLALEWFNLPFLGKDSKTDAPAAVTSSSTPADGGAKRAQANAVDVKSARVRILDKRNNRLSELTLEVGNVASNGDAGAPGVLNLLLKRCVRDVDGVPGQDVAWLEVTEPSADAPLFNGWMFNLNPDVAAMDHPVYDVRLMGCTRAGQTTSTPEKPAEPKVTIDTSAPAVDTETQGAPAGADTEAPAAPSAQPANQKQFGVDTAGDPVVGTPEQTAQPGDATDPYVVPGIGEGTPAPQQPAPQPDHSADTDELNRLMNQQ